VLERQLDRVDDLRQRSQALDDELTATASPVADAPGVPYLREVNAS
jgi:hypothetical protein